MSIISGLNLSDPRQTTPVVIRDAIKNIVFVLIWSAIVIGLSRVSWWVGVIPFWILLVVASICALQYVVSAVLQIILLIGTFINGLRGQWEPFKMQIYKSLGTFFQLLEAAVDVAAIYFLWMHFYGPA